MADTTETTAVVAVAVMGVALVAAAVVTTVDVVTSAFTVVATATDTEAAT